MSRNRHRCGFVAFLPVSVEHLISGGEGEESDSPDSSETDAGLSPAAHVSDPQNVHVSSDFI